MHPPDLCKTKIQNLPKRKKIVKSCNCRNSRCLKLYCECFKQNGFCSLKCSCSNCHNTQREKVERENQLNRLREAVDQVNSETEIRSTKPVAVEKTKQARESPKAVCRCRRSNCMKNYCECFSNGQKCALTCNCNECKNGERENR